MLLVILLGPTLRRVSYLMPHRCKNASFLICFAFNPRIHWNAVKGYHISTFL